MDNKHFNDYSKINKNNTNCLQPGIYIKYINKFNKIISAILIKYKYPILDLKAFNSNIKWKVNILEHDVYYKKNISNSQERMMRYILEGLENKTIILENK